MTGRESAAYREDSRERYLGGPVRWSGDVRGIGLSPRGAVPPLLHRACQTKTGGIPPFSRKGMFSDAHGLCSIGQHMRHN